MDGFLVEGDLSNKFGNCLIYFLAFINTTAYHLGRYESGSQTLTEIDCSLAAVGGQAAGAESGSKSISKVERDQDHRHTREVDCSLARPACFC